MGKTKVKSKAAARADKRARRDNPLGLPELAGTKRREANGRTQRTAGDRLPDAYGETMATRCRHAGVDPTAKNLRDQSAPWRGCIAGRCMSAHAEDDEERQRLWSAILHIRQTWANFDRAIGAPLRHAKCARMEFLPEEMSADATTPPKDERTDDEKQRSAVSAKMAVEGWLGYTDTLAMSETKRVVLDDAPVRDWIGLMSGLRCVADGWAGERMRYRGR